LVNARLLLLTGRSALQTSNTRRGSGATAAAGALIDAWARRLDGGDRFRYSAAAMLGQAVHALGHPPPHAGGGAQSRQDA